MKIDAQVTLYHQIMETARVADKSVGGVDFQCQHLVWKEEG